MSRAEKRWSIATGMIGGLAAMRAWDLMSCDPYSAFVIVLSVFMSTLLLFRRCSA